MRRALSPKQSSEDAGSTRFDLRSKRVPHTRVHGACCIVCAGRRGYKRASRSSSKGSRQGGATEARRGGAHPEQFLVLCVLLGAQVEEGQDAGGALVARGQARLREGGQRGPRGRPLVPAQARVAAPKLLEAPWRREHEGARVGHPPSLPRCTHCAPSLNKVVRSQYTGPSPQD